MLNGCSMYDYLKSIAYYSQECVLLLEVNLPYMTRLVCPSVCHHFLIGWKVSLPCSYQSTCHKYNSINLDINVNVSMIFEYLPKAKTLEHAALTKLIT